MNAAAWVDLDEGVGGGREDAEEKTRDAHDVHTVFTHFSSLSRIRGDAKGEGGRGSGGRGGSVRLIPREIDFGELKVNSLSGIRLEADPVQSPTPNPDRASVLTDYTSGGIRAEQEPDPVAGLKRGGRAFQFSG
jgi:hypothetical protein